MCTSGSYTGKISHYLDMLNYKYTDDKKDQKISQKMEHISVVFCLSWLFSDSITPAPHSDAPWCTVTHKQLSGRVSLCRECFVFSCVNRELGQPPFTDTVDLISPHWLYIFNGLVSVLSGSSSSEQIVVTVLNGAAPNDCFWNQSLAFFNSLNNHRPIPIRTCWKINYILFKDAEESVMLNSNYSNLSLLKTTVSAIYIYI